MSVIITSFPTCPWRRKWQPTPVFWPGKSQGQRNLVGYSPWGRKEWTWLSDFTSYLWGHGLHAVQREDRFALGSFAPGPSSVVCAYPCLHSHRACGTSQVLSLNTRMCIAGRFLKINYYQIKGDKISMNNEQTEAHTECSFHWKWSFRKHLHR